MDSMLTELPMGVFVPHRLPLSDDATTEQRCWVVRLARDLPDESRAVDMSIALTDAAKIAVRKAREARKLPPQIRDVPAVSLVRIGDRHVIVKIFTIRLEQDDAHDYLVAAAAALKTLESAIAVEDIQGIPRRYWRHLIGEPEAA